MAISAHVFSSYVKGGTLWPQKRWAINIMVLDALAQNFPLNPYSEDTLGQLMNSSPSNEQLNALAQIMKMEHCKAGIPVKNIDYRAKLNLEWLKTKLWVVQTFKAYLINTPPTYCHLTPDSFSIVDELQSAIRWLSGKLSLAKRCYIAKVINTTKQLMLKHDSLAALFVFSYHRQFDQTFSGAELVRIKALVAHYELRHYFDDISSLRSEITQKIFTLINSSLEASFKTHLPWVIYDEEWNSHSLQGSYALVEGVSSAYQLFYSRLTEQRHGPIVVTPYHWPDLDGVASCYALTELLHKLGYPQSQALISQTPQFEAQWVLRRLELSLNTIEEHYAGQAVILVDASDPLDIPTQIPREQVIAVIDHRSYYEHQAFQRAWYWVREIGAAASLISSLYQASSATPSPEAANLLYLAIMSNTIQARTHNTSALDLAAIAWLQNFTQLPENIVAAMFHAKSQIHDIYTAIEADTASKLQTLNGASTAVAQLEIVAAAEFIQHNAPALRLALQQVQAARGAEASFLIILDIHLGWTYLIFNDPALQAWVGQHFACAIEEQFSLIYDLYTRKEIIGKLATLI